MKALKLIEYTKNIWQNIYFKYTLNVFEIFWINENLFYIFNMSLSIGIVKPFVYILYTI